MRKPTVIAIVLTVVAVVGSAWTFWPIERYETRHGTFVKMNRYTGEGCTFMPHDSWGQFPLVCLKDIKKTFQPRIQQRSHNSFFIFELKVKVVDDGVSATFVYPNRKAVMQSSGVGATTIYRASDGNLRARTIALSRVPVSFDLPANSSLVEFFHRYF